MTDKTKPNNGYTFTTAVRAPFSDLITPVKMKRTINGQIKEVGDPKYWLTVLLPNDGPDLAAIKALMVRIAKETWPGRKLSELKFPISSGEEAAKAATAKGKDGAFYNGNSVLKTSSGQDKPPSLAVLDGKTITELHGQQRDIIGKQKFYRGCMVVPSIWLSAYKSTAEGGIGESSGITCYISSVLWAADGARIGGGSAAETFRSYAGSVSAEDPTAGSAGASEMDDEIPF